MLNTSAILEALRAQIGRHLPGWQGEQYLVAKATGKTVVASAQGMFEVAEVVRLLPGPALPDMVLFCDKIIEVFSCGYLAAGERKLQLGKMETDLLAEEPHLALTFYYHEQRSHLFEQAPPPLMGSVDTVFVNQQKG